MGPSLAFALHSRCSHLWLIWILCPWCGLGEGAWSQASGSFSSIPFGAMVTSGTVSSSFLGFSLLDPAGLIPGAGWVWEEDEDS